MLDKTGTLTENTLQVQAVILANNIAPEEFYPVLFSLESCSRHPLAQTVMKMKEYKQYADKLPEVEDYTALPGQGMSAIINDLKFMLGSVDFLQKENVDIGKFAAAQNLDMTNSDQSVILLGTRQQVWGMIVLGDVLRQDALQIIAALKQQNLDIVIISGDSPQAVRKTACTLGIEEFYAALSPQQKLEKIRARQAFGRNVVMVGDGVNDAAALAAADISIAMGSGSDAALANADITLLGGNISKLSKLFRLSQAVNRTIKENLFLAFAYNITLIPLAAGFFYTIFHHQFSPVLSSIAMSGSCLLVVFNALRLWKIDLDRQL